MGVYLYSEPDWQLFDETIIANSTTGSSGVIASVNGTFIRPSFSWGGGNGNYQIAVENGYDVITTGTYSHGNCHIGMSDTTYNSLISENDYIKLVIDYFNIGSMNTGSYDTYIRFGGGEYVYIRSNAFVIGDKFTGLSMSLNTPYSITEEISTQDLSCNTIITNMSTSDKYVFNYTKTFDKETNSSYIINGGGPRRTNIGRDQRGGPVSVGNIHIYVA